MPLSFRPELFIGRSLFTSTLATMVLFLNARASLAESPPSAFSGVFGQSAAHTTLFNWGNSPELGGPDLSAPLVTDRPDFTEASSTVGRGVTQIELGYTYGYNSDQGEGGKSHSIGEPLLRHGLFAEWLELRVGLAPVQESTRTLTSRTKTSGLEDLYVGFKLALTPQDVFLPEMALIPQMTIPTGSESFSDDRTLPGLNWIYSWELTDSISTAGSTQFNIAVDDATGSEYTEWAQSWTVATSLTERLGMYTEWFAFFPDNADTAQVEHYVNGGFTWLINNDLQFDVRAGTGLTGAAEDFFTGAGLSIRFP
ncbi:MAG: transporter [Planctomycetaceae bacterium]